MTPEIVTATALDTVQEWFPRYPSEDDPVVRVVTVARSDEYLTLAATEQEWPYGTRFFRVSIQVEEEDA